MPSHDQTLGVLLVPAASAAREPLLHAAAQAGLRVVEDPEHAAIGLVDFTAPQAREALGLLLESSAGSRLSYLALVPPRQDSFAELEALRPAEVMVAGGPPFELLSRLRRVAERHGEREEHLWRQRDLSLLLELSADYAESPDVEALLHDVTRKLAQRLDITRASLVMIDRTNDTGRIVATSDDPSLKDLRIELDRYPEIREVVRTGRPVILEDASNHPLLEGVQRAVAAQRIHAIAALPLPIRGEVRGVLMVRAAGEGRRTFSPHEVGFLITVAHATAVALRNASLLELVRGETEREMTARIAAEAKAASLETYHLFFANVREGVAILDDKACVLSLNPAGATILDTAPEAAIGRHLVEATRPVDEAVLMELVAAARRGESRTDVDLVCTPGGRKLTLSLSTAPLEDGRRALILSFRDVTQARKLANELGQTKDFLERLIDSSVDAVVAADMRGRIILFNKGAEALSGYTSAEAISGLHVRQFYPPGVAERIMEQLRSPEHGGRGRLSLNRQDIMHRSGQRVPVNMTASIVYEGGREVASVGIFTDLRDRMELERKLSDVETRLEESEKNAVIVALAGTAAHELNQPLTSVMGYAELLKRKLKEDDSSYKPVDIIYREAERMAEIVRKIGRITRYETKAYLGSQRIVDLDKASSHDD